MLFFRVTFHCSTSSPPPFFLGLFLFFSPCTHCKPLLAKFPLADPRVLFLFTFFFCWISPFFQSQAREALFRSRQNSSPLFGFFFFFSGRTSPPTRRTFLTFPAKAASPAPLLLMGPPFFCAPCSENDSPNPWCPFFFSFFPRVAVFFFWAFSGRL